MLSFLRKPEILLAFWSASCVTVVVPGEVSDFYFLPLDSGIIPRYNMAETGGAHFGCLAVALQDSVRS